MSGDALFPDLLGPHWASLPPSVRAMHGGRPLVRARGRVDVDGDTRLPARLLRALFGLPAPVSGAAGAAGSVGWRRPRRRRDCRREGRRLKSGSA